MCQTQLQQYWQAYLTSLPNTSSRTEGYVAEKFGDNASLADELGNLILRGTKTATCSALWEWEAEGGETPSARD